LFRRLKVVSDQEERAHIGWTLGSLAAPRLENLPALTDALTASLDSHGRENRLT
jgi:hypothetical protein